MTNNYKTAIAKLTDWCSRAEKCKSEVIKKLREHELSDNEIIEAIIFLQSEKYFDNQRYATSFVRDKFRFNKWGKIKIAFMLRQKGVENEIIQTAISEIDDEEYQQTIVAILQTKVKFVKSKTNRERATKLAVFAQSRGFELNLAIKIANQIVGANIDD